MKRMGLGGFFMHSRVGLDTAYLSDEWFECVDACVDEGNRIDMNAWLYDEDRWPSGAAGGLVTKNPKFRMRHLHMEILNKPSDLKWDKDMLAAFRAKVEAPNAHDVRPLARGSRPDKLAPGESLIVLRAKIDASTSWYNGYTYLDTMSHEAVEKFIEVTHKAYLKRYGKEFGKRIPGIFTDEPNFGRVMLGWDASPNAVPWTEKTAHDFQEEIWLRPSPALGGNLF